MTSTKSSVNHAARYDLKRCLKENALIPFVLTVLSSYLLWYFVKSTYNGEEFLWTFFNEYTGFDETLFSMGYMSSGALMAIKAFFFLTSTKRCNVYLSAGIERKTLLKNRLSTSLVYMFISCIVPLIVGLIANGIFYSVAADTVKSAVYLSLCFFLNMLLGFGAASAVMLSVGNIIEATGIYAVLAMIPSTINLAVDRLGNNMFNGFAVFKSEDFWGSQAYFPDWLTKIKYFMPVEISNFIPVSARTYSNFNGISSVNWLTLLCWYVAAILIIVLLPMLMKKRKAEIAGAFGADRKLVAIASGIIAFLMFSIWCGFELNNNYLRYALMIVMPVIGYTIPVVVIYHNDKGIKNNLIGAAVTAAICILLTTCSATNCFGYFSKPPKAEEIEYAAIMPAACETFEKSSERTLIYHNTLYGKITDPNDNNKVISIHERITDDLGKGESWVSVVYKLKSGRTVGRIYRDVSDEGAKASMEFIETKQYKNFVNEVLSLSEYDEDKEREKLSVDFEKVKTRIEQQEYKWASDMFEFKADYTNSVPVILNSTLSDKIYLDKLMPKDEILAFKKALAADLTNMTVAQVFYPEEKPLFYVHFYRYDYEVDDGRYEQKNFPVYSFMSNTMSFLNKYNIDQSDFNHYTLEDIDAVQIKNVREEIEFQQKWNRSNFVRVLDRTVCATFVKDYYYEDDGRLFIQSDLSTPQEVTDKKTIERYFNNYRSQYSYIGDNGIFVQFFFKDGGNLIAYVPEKFV